MVIYEVNLEVEPSIAREYSDWLLGHVDDMLALDGFEAATIYRVESDDERKRWSVHYRLTDRAALERYFQGRAAEMRRDAVERFGHRFSASRRILTPDEATAASGD